MVLGDRRFLGVRRQFIRCSDLHFGFAGVRWPNFTWSSICPKFLPSRWMRHTIHRFARTKISTNRQCLLDGCDLNT